MADARAPTVGDERLSLATRFAMLIGGLMVTIAMSALTPVLPQIENALAHSASDKLLVKMLVPIIGVAMVVGAPLTGFLVDRIGLRKVLIAHGLLFAIGGTAGLYLTDLRLLLGSRLLVGLGAAGMSTIGMTMINTRLDGNARARWMGYHISIAMFGSLVVHPLIGVLGEMGWRWPFSVYLFGLSVVAASLLGLQEPRRISRPDVSAPKVSANPLRWFPRWFLPLALVMGGVTYFPNVYLGYVVRSVGVASPSIIAMVMLSDAIIGATMALLFGRSQRYISSEAAFMWSFGCVGLGMLVVSLSTSLAGVICGMLIFGFGVGWFVPNLMTSLSRRVSQDHQGQAVGIIKAVHYLASPLGVLAVEPIARASGPAGAFMAASSLALAMAAIFGWAVVQRRRAGPMGLSMASAAR